MNAKHLFHVAVGAVTVSVLPMAVQDASDGYINAVMSDSPTGYWRLGDASGPPPRRTAPRPAPPWTVAA